MSNKLTKPGEASLLPQYFHSECMYERFLDATLKECEEIFRARNQSGIKIADHEEQEFDNLKYFVANKKVMEEQFFNDLSKAIGKDRADLFCKVISEYWYDGRSKRESKTVLELMASVKTYLLGYRKAKNPDDIQVINEIDPKIKAIFNDDEVNDILAINRQLLEIHLNNWIKDHPKFDEMGLGGIYCRRGVFLDELFTSTAYLEWQYINSYSLSFSVTEKFSQMVPGKTQAILNTNFANLRDRILFFSPFIKGMSPYQLELGIIPHWFSLKISLQGEHGGIHEYNID